MKSDKTNDSNAANIKNITKQLAVLAGLSVLLVILFASGYYYGSRMEESRINVGNAVELPEGDTEEEILNKNAEYVVEAHDLDSDKITSETEKLPVEFIGLSKSDVIDYITSHKEQFQDKNEEIQNISMISFSHDTLVLRKDVTKSLAISETAVNYSPENGYNYYIVLEDGVLVVYKKDKTTVFLETGIVVEDLQEEEREQLTRGIGVKNISELYRYLEGYTS